MKKLLKYSLLVPLSITGIAQAASVTTINRRLARLKGHMTATPTTAAKKLAVAKTNAEVQDGPRELTAEQQKQIEDVINGLVYEKTIFDYVEENDLEGLKKIAHKSGFDINAKNKNSSINETVLIRAAMYGRLEMVKYVMSLRDTRTGELLVNVNAKDLMNDTALTWAAYAAHIDIIRFLVGLRDISGNFLIDLNARNSKGDTALMSAIEKDHLEIIRLEIVRCLAGLQDATGKCLVDLNAKNNWGNTALMLAAGKGCLNIVEYLLSLQDESGNYLVDVHVLDKNGQSALKWAHDCKNNNTQVIALLEQAERERAQQPIRSRL